MPRRATVGWKKGRANMDNAMIGRRGERGRRECCRCNLHTRQSRIALRFAQANRTVLDFNRFTVMIMERHNGLSTEQQQHQQR